MTHYENQKFLTEKAARLNELAWDDGFDGLIINKITLSDHAAEYLVILRYNGASMTVEYSQDLTAMGPVKPPTFMDVVKYLIKDSKDFSDTMVLPRLRTILGVEVFDELISCAPDRMKPIKLPTFRTCTAVAP